MSADVTLVRFPRNGNQTEGIMIVNANGWKCYTIELPWINNKRNVSCIPPGRYRVEWTESRRFKKYTYQIMDVPGRSGIRFHVANYARELEGCIGTGMARHDIDKDGAIDVINSKTALNAFELIMNHQPFTLQIIE